jgi:hypothetical protein
MHPKNSVKQIDSIKNSRYFDEIQELTRSLGEKLPKENKPIPVIANPKRLKVYEQAPNRYIEGEKR